MELEMLALRAFAAVILSVLLLQAFRHQTNVSNEDLLIHRIRWGAIIVLLVFICSGLSMGDSDPSQDTATQVLINKQNILRLNDFYTFIPLGFCLGIIIYGISQIIFAKRNMNKSF